MNFLNAYSTWLLVAVDGGLQQQRITKLHGITCADHSLAKWAWTSGSAQSGAMLPTYTLVLAGSDLIVNAVMGWRCGLVIEPPALPSRNQRKQVLQARSIYWSAACTALCHAPTPPTPTRVQSPPTSTQM